MKKTRFTEHQIVGILLEAETGISVKDLCRKHGVGSANRYQWKSKYWRQAASDLKRVRGLGSALTQTSGRTPRSPTRSTL